ncbi:UNVERIFIED_CONTAM: hypothetical protein RMT77_013830 [Armadillidium vulgare]
MATALNTSGNQQSSSLSSTVVEPEGPIFSSEEQVGLSSGVVRLKLNKNEERKKVKWTNDTVDNEHMGKKKSKCCCVYVRPKAFNESSSEDDSDGECEHCSGHVEKRKQKPIPLEHKEEPPT